LAVSEEEDMLKRAFGSRVRDLREKRRWALQELADRIGVNLPQMSRYETGHHFPDMVKLVRIATSLDTTLDFLLRGTDERTTSNARLSAWMRELETCEHEDVEVVINVIDAVVGRRRLGKR
jgi:transcriptional regulator with XRE-family HTH domain